EKDDYDEISPSILNAIKKSRINIDFARALACRLNDEEKFRAFLTIVKATKDLQDLKELSNCLITPAVIAFAFFIEDELETAINIALYDFNDISIARTILNNYIEDFDFAEFIINEFLNAKFNGFIKIYEVSNDIADLNQAERILSLMIMNDI